LVSLDEETVATLLGDADAAGVIKVDLVAQEISRPCGEVVSFEIDAEVRETLLAGTDEITETLSQIEAIWTFEEAHRQRCPWL